MNIILFGPPGAGKGTQAKFLVEKINGYQISTGNMLRLEIQKNSKIGKEIINDMNDGKFVSDEIVNWLIFDWYPRSISQAKNIESLLKNSNQKIDLIFFLNVNKETIVKRIEKRKIIEQRTDDDLNTILKRYDTYMQTTRPVLDYYSKNPNFYEIDGSLKIDDITAKIEAFINV